MLYDPKLHQNPLRHDRQPYRVDQLALSDDLSRLICGRVQLLLHVRPDLRVGDRGGLE